MRVPRAWESQTYPAMRGPERGPLARAPWLCVDMCLVNVPPSPPAAIQTGGQTEHSLPRLCLKCQPGGLLGAWLGNPWP